jgi:conjugative transfer pilus assembly protein TraH
MRIFKIITIVTLLSLSPLYGNLDGEMNKFFKKLGSSSSNDSSAAYNGQKAGYLQGGGSTVRNRVMNSKIANINMPRFDAGCGGIDLYAGGFSFINKDELVNNLKSIGSNAVGYAFLLGLQTVSPQIATTVEQLQGWSNDINNMNINSCETASQLVNAAWPKKTEASQHICRSIGGKDGLLNDYASGRHSCSSERSQEDVQKEINESPKYKDILSGDFNVAWEAIKKQKEVTRDKELSHLLMTITGTIVSRKEGEETKMMYLSSKVSDQNFLAGLIKGGDDNSEMYVCENNDNNKCLFPKVVKMNLSKKSSFSGKTLLKLESIQQKIISDSELSDDEIDLVNKTKFPLYSYINILAANPSSVSLISLQELSEVIAIDLIEQYIQESLEVIRAGVNQLKGKQYDATDLNKFEEGFYRIEETIRNFKINADRGLNRQDHMVKKIQNAEKLLYEQINLN